MARRYSIAEARARFPGVVREAEEGYPVEISRRGTPVAVLLSVEEYRRLAKRRTQFSDAYDRFRSSSALAELDIDPDEVFAGVREPSPGRDVEL